MIYVALLRGINVGGNSKVEMSRLKTVFEAIGCADVRTYINSGNVIFSDTRSPSQLKALIESAIANEFKLAVPIVLRTRENISHINTAVPASWTNDSQQKTDVLFLWDAINSPDVLAELAIKPDYERTLYVDGAVIWNIDRQFVTRSSLLKIIKTDLYKQMTVRNINTVRKLDQLMQEIDG